MVSACPAARRAAGHRSRLGGVALGFGFCLAFSFVPRTARADDVTAIDSAINSYDTARWDECVERFQVVLRSPTLRDVGQKNRARMYFAACLVSLGQEKQADAQMEQIVRDDILYVPDKVAFSSRVLDRFTETRVRLRDEIAEKEKERILAEIAARKAEEERKKKAEERVARLEQLATEEVSEKRGSRWIAMVPFGVGQFQNRQVGLGIGFLSAEVALGAASITTALLSGSIQRQAQQANADRAAAQILNDRVVLANRLTFGAFATVAVVGIVHAQTTFVPSFRETKQRPLPAELRIEPSVSKDFGGLELRGSF
jgi:hypothetical protein